MNTRIRRKIDSISIKSELENIICKALSNRGYDLDVEYKPNNQYRDEIIINVYRVEEST